MTSNGRLADLVLSLVELTHGYHFLAKAVCGSTSSRYNIHYQLGIHLWHHPRLYRQVEPFNPFKWKPHILYHSTKLAKHICCSTGDSCHTWGKLIAYLNVSSCTDSNRWLGHSSKHYPRPMLLDFSDRMGTGIFNTVSW